MIHQINKTINYLNEYLTVNILIYAGALCNNAWFRKVKESKDNNHLNSVMELYFESSTVVDHQCRFTGKMPS